MSTQQPYISNIHKKLDIDASLDIHTKLDALTFSLCGQGRLNFQEKLYFHNQIFTSSQNFTCSKKLSFLTNSFKLIMWPESIVLVVPPIIGFYTSHLFHILMMRTGDLSYNKHTGQLKFKPLK